MNAQELYESRALRSFLRRLDEETVNDFLRICEKVLRTERDENNPTFNITLALSSALREVLQSKRTVAVLTGGKA